MRSVFITLTLLIGLLIFLMACSGTATPAPVSAPTPTQEEMMEHEMVAEPQGHGQELHGAAHGGQVGMAAEAAVGGGDFHLEIVSDAPGQYRVYLSDENRKPVSPEGYEGTLAVIRPDGSEIASMPLMVMGGHLQAEGGPTDVSQVDVRITLKGLGLSDTLEMDFTIPY
ncbi:MAG: hypothetical protein HYR94_29650 [Chloroflexi bacterium]|nr:hypothetical protein [Chloroflexota bacterium]